MTHEESVSIAFVTGMVGWFFILPGIISGLLIRAMSMKPIQDFAKYYKNHV
jgi:hypothetical protein